jgi:hypothetical protein
MPLVLLLPLYWLLPESIHHLAISNKHSDDIHKIAARLNPQITHSSDTSYVLNESPLEGLSFKYLFLQDRANKTL